MMRNPHHRGHEAGEIMPNHIAILGSLLMGLAATLGTIVIHGFAVHTIIMTLRRNLQRGVLGPRTPFCLSSGDSRGVDFLAARVMSVKTSGKVTLQGSNGVEFGMPFGELASDVVLGPLIGSQATDSDDVQRAIGGAISSTIEPMPDGPSRRRRNRADAA